jgi:hypothetical protein
MNIYRNNKWILSERGWNVPAESTSPEPEGFFGIRECSVPNLPFPNPQHLAEALPDPWSEKA